MLDKVSTAQHIEALKVSASVIPDGVYFGMSEDVYHGDPALGSSGLKKLIDNAPDFWWESSFNPARPEDDDTPAKIFGRQLHQCVLEGADKFQAGHAPRHLNASTKEGKAEKQAIIDAGKVPVAFKDWTKILAASAFITANKTLANAFQGGYPEVSVFWTEDEIRFKCRFDYLKMNAITDLKSIANMHGKEFGRACKEAIASYDYIVSAEHYRHGRAQMSRLIREQKVHGAPEIGPNGAEFIPWLINVASNKVYSFVFVFYQKDGAPISHGIKISIGNPIFETGRALISKAIGNYRRFMQEFGTDAAWVPSTPLEELQETDLPVWYQQRLMHGA
jgi:hypothetical protein